MKFLRWFTGLFALTSYKTKDDLGPPIPVIPPSENPFSPFYKEKEEK